MRSVHVHDRDDCQLELGACLGPQEVKAAEHFRRGQKQPISQVHQTPGTPTYEMREDVNRGLDELVIDMLI